jgi:uncharacterized protein (TIGR02246 family)
MSRLNWPVTAALALASPPAQALPLDGGGLGGGGVNEERSLPADATPPQTPPHQGEGLRSAEFNLAQPSTSRIGDDVLEAETAAIVALIGRMEAAWNRGDFRGYMEGFANPDVVFVSRGKFQDGWQGTLDHYIRDYGASEATRGTLKFWDIKVEMLAPDAAQLISRYRLSRPERSQEGINTRLMRKRDGKWVIALNHVSAVEN